MERTRTRRFRVLSWLVVLVTCMSVCMSEEEVVAEADEMAKRIEEESKKVEAQSNAMVSAIDKNSNNVDDKELGKAFEEASQRVDNVMDKSEKAVDEKAQKAEELANEAERNVEELGRKIEGNGSSRKRSTDSVKSGKMPSRRTSVTYKVEIPSEPSFEQQIDDAVTQGERMTAAVYKNRETNSEPMDMVFGNKFGELQNNMEDGRSPGNFYRDNQFHNQFHKDNQFQEQEIQGPMTQNDDQETPGYSLDQGENMERFNDGLNSAPDDQDDAEQTDKHVDEDYSDNSVDEQDHETEEETDDSVGDSTNVDVIYTNGNPLDFAHKNIGTTKEKDPKPKIHKQPIITVAEYQENPGLVSRNKTEKSPNDHHQHRQNDLLDLPFKNKINVHNHNKNPSRIDGQLDKQHSDGTTEFDLVNNNHHQHRQNNKTLDLPSKNHVDNSSSRIEQLDLDTPSKNKATVHNHGKNSIADHLEHVEFDLVNSTTSPTTSNKNESVNALGAAAATQLVSQPDTISKVKDGNIVQNLMDEIEAADYMKLKKKEETKKELSDLGASNLIGEIESQWRKLKLDQTVSQQGNQQGSLITPQEIEFLQNERPGDKSVMDFLQGKRKSETHPKLKAILKAKRKNID